MQKLKVTFLGTGTSQGVPVIACPCEVCNSDNPKDKRLRCSIHLETEGKSFVIDSGPDFRQQMLKFGIKNLDALVFTHEHKDHIAGMDDIRAYNYVLGKKIDVYASALVQKAMQYEFPYIFAEIKYPGIPEINLHLIENRVTNIQGVEFLPIEVKHYNLPVFGYRIGDFTYITDANYISDNEKQKIKGSKVFVINALRHTKHVSHYNLEEALALIEELKPETTYLTHISHQLGLHDEVNKKLPPNVFCAYDGLVIRL